MAVFSNALQWLKIRGSRSNLRLRENACTNATKSTDEKEPSYSVRPISKKAQADIPNQEVHELSQDDKTRLLQNYHSRYTHELEKGRNLLSILEENAPSLLPRFALNDDPVSAFTFRLINRNLRLDAGHLHDSFIALSYCWPPTQREELSHGNVVDRAQKYNLPMDSLMYEALLDQTESAREGIWIDQICIDQLNGVEKAAALSAMAAVYRCARVVVAALWDVRIDAESEKWLEKYGGDLSSSWNVSFPEATLQAKVKDPFFRQLAKNIFSSRWFDRAWCSHEMKLGQKLVFLVPCDGTEQPRYLRFGAAFLKDIHHLFTASIEHTDSTLENPTDTTLNDASSVHELELAERVSAATFQSMKSGKVLIAHEDGRAHKLVDYDESSTDTSYTTHTREIFELGAGGDPTLPEPLRSLDANFDKATIVLNTVGDGLVLKKPNTYEGHDDQFSQGQLFASLMLLGLISGDPIALCTSGPQLHGGGEATWITQPSNWDIKFKKLQPLHKIPLNDIRIDPASPFRSIEVYCIQLGPGILPGNSTVSLSKDFIDRSLELGIPDAFKDITDHRKTWRSHIKASQAAYDRFVATVACIIHCDLVWIIRTSARCGYEAHSRLEQGISINFRHEDINTVKLEYFSLITWHRNWEDRSLVEMILEFANWMIMAATGDGATDSIVMPLVHKLKSGEKFVVFKPLEGGIVSAVPRPVLQRPCARLARVWNMDITKSADQSVQNATEESVDSSEPTNSPTEAVLRGKTVLFGDVCCEKDFGDGAGGWFRVYGPST